MTPHAPPEPLQAPGASQLASSSQALALRLMLAFTSPAFERRFIAHSVASYHRYAQAALGLGLLLVAGDFLVDWFAHPALTANWLRLQVAVPILVGGLAYTFLPQARVHWQPVLSGFIVALACCLFWILLLIDAEGGSGLSSWVGILNFTFLQFYCFVILGVQFRLALISGLLILAAFSAALWGRPSVLGTAMAYWTYHVVTLFMLAAGIGWWREFLLRKDLATQAALHEAREAAERSTRAKSVFLATMSHEIRTPMNAVIGLTHLLRRDSTDPAQAERIGRVADAAQHLLHIINDVLDVSRIESGKLELESVDFDLERLLAGCCALVEGSANDKGLVLLNHSADLPRWLRGDPTRLSQALVNLLGNAVKFTEQGSVTLESRVVASTTHDTLLRFEVRDTGIGVAPDRVDALFHAFEQADSSTTRRFGGSGLGLSITRHLAELMGGEAGVVSQLGQGSSFWLTARIRNVERVEVTQKSGACGQEQDGGPFEQALRARHTDARVLLAEDNPINLEVATALLRMAGLSVDVALDGEQAVAMARQGSYALVLLDMQMPVMDGLQASRALRALPRFEKLPIIAMTANAFGDDRLACLAAGMNDHLAKPVEPEVLYEMLWRWLPAAEPSF